MNRQTRIYLLLVICLAAVALPFQDWSALWGLSSEHASGVVALIGLGLLSEALSVRSTVGTHQITSSIAFLPYFAAVLLFPPPAAVTVVMVTFFATQVAVQKKPLFRAVFNTAQAILAIIIATKVFQLLGGHYSAALTSEFVSRTGLTSLAGMAVTFFLVNQLSVGIAIAFSTGNRVRTVFGRIVAPSGANLLYDVLVSPIAVVIAVVYGSFGVAGLAMVTLPLLIIRHSYMSTLKLQQANKDLLSVLVKTIETRDPYTSGHSIRVSILARAIAEDMDLSATRVDTIEMTALVHDIGKVDAIYASIIRKEGSLTDAERHIIVTHAAKGAEFLKTLTSFSSDVVDGVRHHHERYNGTGYPDGLVGDAIPLPARIIQLCDSIDAMLSDRPYRKALTVEYVRGELIRCAGTQFDPRIVEIILKRNTLERAAALVRPEKVKPQLVVASA
ncbi:MAG: HD-GYP domain-containing protein [Gemmatimonadota bacterium]